MQLDLAVLRLSSNLEPLLGVFVHNRRFIWLFFCVAVAEDAVFDPSEVDKSSKDKS